MKLKKALIFVLCAIMMFSLVACSKAGPSDAPIGGPGDDFDPTKEYTVTFSVGAEAEAAGVTIPSRLATQTAKGGETIWAMPTPSKYEGYTFVGWYEGNEQFTETTRIGRDWHCVATWRSQAEADAEAQAYEDNISSWDKPGHLYIHYKRFDHNQAEEGRVNPASGPEYDDEAGKIDSAIYSDWGLWVWPTNGPEGEYKEGILFNPAKIDLSGAVYDVLLDHTYAKGGWDETTTSSKNLPVNYVDQTTKKVKAIAMQLFMKSTRELEGFWSNDGGNIDLNLDLMKRERTGGYSYHWFVNQSNVGAGSPTFSTKPVVDPYAGKPAGSCTTNHTVKEGNGVLNSNADNRTKYDINKVPVQDYDDVGVGYQVFLASFADGKKDDEYTEEGKGMGDLRGVINKLDEGYFDKLNVDVLWLTPFQTSSGYHGYDIKDYFSVDPRFGTISDLRELVYKAHHRAGGKRIRVIMDSVFNHTSTSNPWYVKSQNLVQEETADGSVIDYRNFYNWINEEQYNELHNCTPESKKADGHVCDKDQWYKDNYGYYFYSSFSSDMPELNYDYQPVRDAIIDVCNYWMEFGLDGFRLDAVKHIYMRNEIHQNAGRPGTIIADKDYKKNNPKIVGNTAGGDNGDPYAYDQTRNLNFWREFNYRLKCTYPNAFLVAENLDGNPANTAPFYEGLDSQFDFNLYYDATRALNDTDASHANWAGLIKAYYKGRDGETNGTGYASHNSHYIGGQFTSNHDLPRALDRLNATTTGNDDTYRGFYSNGTKVTGKESDINSDMVYSAQDKLRLYYAFIMTIPGVTWIYNGDEIGMSGLMPHTVTTGSTSSTVAPHADRVYRQPMKWYTDVNKNSSFDINFQDFKCELEGLNTTSYVGSVEAQEKDDNSILAWVKKLTAIRDKYPALMRGTVEGNSSTSTGGRDYSEYTVKMTGEKSIKVCISNGSSRTYSTTGKLAAFKGLSNDGRYWVTIEEVK